MKVGWNVLSRMGESVRRNVVLALLIGISVLGWGAANAAVLNAFEAADGTVLARVVRVDITGSQSTAEQNPRASASGRCIICGPALFDARVELANGKPFCFSTCWALGVCT